MGPGTPLDPPVEGQERNRTQFETAQPAPGVPRIREKPRPTARFAPR